MTKDEFYNATEGLLIKDSLKVATYMFLVEKAKLSDIELASGHKVQAIQRKAREIWDLHESTSEKLPSGWTKKEVALPNEEMEVILKRSKDLLHSIKNSVPDNDK